MHDNVTRDENKLAHSYNGKPSVVMSDLGITTYHKHGKLHRLDGPAIIFEENSAYLQDGQLHREDGPAIILKNIDMEFFFLGGYLLDEEDYWKEIEAMESLDPAEKEWHLFSLEKRHHYSRKFVDDRVSGLQYISSEVCGGPPEAKVFSIALKGEIYYKTHYQIHRGDGPAVIGHNYWAKYRDNELHCEDGPAEWRKDGDKEVYRWYIQGIEFTEEEYKDFYRDYDQSDFIKIANRFKEAAKIDEENSHDDYITVENIRKYLDGLFEKMRCDNIVAYLSALTMDAIPDIDNDAAFTVTLVAFYDYCCNISFSIAENNAKIMMESAKSMKAPYGHFVHSLFEMVWNL